jgi:hypothetical protein
LGNSIFQSAIKGAIIGALTAATSELIRLGLDPNKKSFSWANVFVGGFIGLISGAASHYFREKIC